MVSRWYCALALQPAWWCDARETLHAELASFPGHPRLRFLIACSFACLQLQAIKNRSRGRPENEATPNGARGPAALRWDARARVERPIRLSPAISRETPKRYGAYAYGTRTSVPYASICVRVATKPLNRLFFVFIWFLLVKITD